LVGLPSNGYLRDPKTVGNQRRGNRQMDDEAPSKAMLEKEREERIRERRDRIMQKIEAQKVGTSVDATQERERRKEVSDMVYVVMTMREWIDRDLGVERWV